MDDSVRLAREAGLADVNVTVQIWPHMIHAWPMWNAKITEGRQAVTHWLFEWPREAQPLMQVSWSVVVASAAAAFWSPFAAAACALDTLMDPPLAARADAGSSAAITMHKTKRMIYLRFGFHVNSARARTVPARVR